MEFFTLITQVSSRSDHPDTRMGKRAKQIDIGLWKEQPGEKTWLSHRQRTNQVI